MTNLGQPGMPAIIGGLSLPPPTSIGQFAQLTPTAVKLSVSRGSCSLGTMSCRATSLLATLGYRRRVVTPAADGRRHLGLGEFLGNSLIPIGSSSDRLSLSKAPARHKVLCLSGPRPLPGRAREVPDEADAADDGDMRGSNGSSSSAAMLEENLQKVTTQACRLYIAAVKETCQKLLALEKSLSAKFNKIDRVLAYATEPRDMEEGMGGSVKALGLSDPPMGLKSVMDFLTRIQTGLTMISRLMTTVEEERRQVALSRDYMSTAATTSADSLQRLLALSLDGLLPYGEKLVEGHDATTAIMVHQTAALGSWMEKAEERAIAQLKAESEYSKAEVHVRELEVVMRTQEAGQASEATRRALEEAEASADHLAEAASNLEAQVAEAEQEIMRVTTELEDTTVLGERLAADVAEFERYKSAVDSGGMMETMWVSAEEAGSKLALALGEVEYVMARFEALQAHAAVLESSLMTQIKEEEGDSSMLEDSGARIIEEVKDIQASFAMQLDALKSAQECLNRHVLECAEGLKVVLAHTSNVALFKKRLLASFPDLQRIQQLASQYPPLPPGTELGSSTAALKAAPSGGFSSGGSSSETMTGARGGGGWSPSMLSSSGAGTRSPSGSELARELADLKSMVSEAGFVTGGSSSDSDLPLSNSQPSGGTAGRERKDRFAALRDESEGVSAGGRGYSDERESSQGGWEGGGYDRRREQEEGMMMGEEQDEDAAIISAEQRLLALQDIIRRAQSESGIERGEGGDSGEGRNEAGGDPYARGAQGRGGEEYGEGDGEDEGEGALDLSNLRDIVLDDGVEEDVRTMEEQVLMLGEEAAELRHLQQLQKEAVVMVEEARDRVLRLSQEVSASISSLQEREMAKSYTSDTKGELKAALGQVFRSVAQLADQVAAGAQDAGPVPMESSSSILDSAAKLANIDVPSELRMAEQVLLATKKEMAGLKKALAVRDMLVEQAQTRQKEAEHRTDLERARAKDLSLEIVALKEQLSELESQLEAASGMIQNQAKEVEEVRARLAAEEVKSAERVEAERAELAEAKQALQRAEAALAEEAARRLEGDKNAEARWRAQLAQGEAALEASRDELKAVRAQMAEVEARAGQASKERSEVSAQVVALNAQLASVTASLEASTRQLDDAAARLSAAKAEQELLHDKLMATETLLADKERLLLDQEARSAEVKEALRVAKGQVEALERANQTLKQEVSALEQKLTAMLNEQAAARASSADSDARLRSREASITRLEAELSTMGTQFAALKKALAAQEGELMALAEKSEAAAAEHAGALRAVRAEVAEAERVAREKEEEARYATAALQDAVADARGKEREKVVMAERVRAAEEASLALQQQLNEARLLETRIASLSETLERTQLLSAGAVDEVASRLQVREQELMATVASLKASLAAKEEEAAAAATREADQAMQSAAANESAMEDFARRAKEAAEGAEAEAAKWFAIRKESGDRIASLERQLAAAEAALGERGAPPGQDFGAAELELMRTREKALEADVARLTAELTALSSSAGAGGNAAGMTALMGDPAQVAEFSAQLMELEASKLEAEQRAAKAEEKMREVLASAAAAEDRLSEALQRAEAAEAKLTDVTLPLDGVAAGGSKPAGGSAREAVAAKRAAREGKASGWQEMMRSSIRWGRGTSRRGKKGPAISLPGSKRVPAVGVPLGASAGSGEGDSAAAAASPEARTGDLSASASVVAEAELSARLDELRRQLKQEIEARLQVEQEMEEVRQRAQERAEMAAAAAAAQAAAEVAAELAAAEEERKLAAAAAEEEERNATLLASSAAAEGVSVKQAESARLGRNLQRALLAVKELAVEVEAMRSVRARGRATGGAPSADKGEGDEGDDDGEEGDGDNGDDKATKVVAMR
eukprot:jgi/Mesvir1/13004/Mv06008-RA.1